MGLVVVKEVRGSIIYKNEANKLIVETGRRHTDFPLVRTDGKVVYDFPERVPAYLKEAVRHEFDRVRYSNDYRTIPFIDWVI